MEGKNAIKAGLILFTAFVAAGVVVVLFEQHVSKTKPKTV
jgi:hypothetical protein